MGFGRSILLGILFLNFFGRRIAKGEKPAFTTDYIAHPPCRVPPPCDLSRVFPQPVPLPTAQSVVPTKPTVRICSQPTCHYENASTTLPSTKILVTTNKMEPKYKLDSCDLLTSQDECKITFVPSVDTCDGKVTLRSVIKHFFPGNHLQTISASLIRPNKYEIVKFQVDKCSGTIIMNATGTEPVKILPNALKITKSELYVTLSYNSPSLSFADIDFALTGTLMIQTSALHAIVQKKKGETIVMYKIKTDQLKVKNFVQLFTRAELKEGVAVPDDPFETGRDAENLQLLASSTFENPVILGVKAMDGFFEFITTGTVKDPVLNRTTTGVLIIQKKPGSLLAIALVLKYSLEKPASVLSTLLDESLKDIPIIGEAVANFTLQVANNDIGLAKHSRIKNVLKDYSNGVNFISKGARLKAMIPIVSIIQMRNSASDVSGLSKNAKLDITIRNKVLKFQLPERIQINLDLLLTLLSSAKVHKLPKKQMLFSGDPPVMNFEGFEVDVQTKTISITTFSVGNVYYGNGIAAVANPRFTLERHGLKKPWRIVANGKIKLELGYLEQLVERRKGFGYIYTAKASTIKVREVAKIFKAIFVSEYMLKKRKYLNFTVRDFVIRGRVGPNMKLRFAGKPDLFGWKNVKCEGLIFRVNGKTIMVMGIVLENIKLFDFIYKFFKKKLVHAEWISRLNIGLTLSSYTFEAVKKTPSFHHALLKDYPMRQVNQQQKSYSQSYAFEQGLLALLAGIYVSAKVDIPPECHEDLVCEEIKSLVREGTEFELKGQLEANTLRLTSRYSGFLRLGHQMDIQQLEMIVQVDKAARVFFELVVQIKEPTLILQGEIYVGQTGAAELSLSMTKAWKNPFGISYAYFSNVTTRVVIQAGIPIQKLRFKGLFCIGADGGNKGLVSTATIIIHPSAPTQNYFYSELKDFDLSTLVRVFNINVTMPKLLKDSFFPDGVIASFAFDPAGKTVSFLPRKIDAGFRISGIINVTGYKVPCEISINFPNEIIVEVNFPPFPIGTSRISLYRGRYDIENGPKLVIKLAAGTSVVTLNGYGTVLGISSDLSIKIRDNEIKFFVSGQFFNTYPSNTSVLASSSRIDTADFKISGCLSSAIPDINTKTTTKLINIAEESKEALEEAKMKVAKFTKIYDASKHKYLIFEQKSSDQEKQIQRRCDKVEEIKKELNDDCVDSCGTVCIGGPRWVKHCTSILGNWISCCKWDKCKHKVPDTTCIARCKGMQVIKSTSIEKKQAGIDILLGALKSIKLSLIFTKSFMSKCKVLLAQATKGLETVRNAADVGTEINQAIANYTREGLISLMELCYKSSLEKALSSCLEFSIRALYYRNKKLSFTSNGCVDGTLSETIAKKISEKMYPALKVYKKQLERGKAIFEDLSTRKAELQKDIEEEEKFSSHDEYQKRSLVPSDKEAYFRQIAYAEVPEVSLVEPAVVAAFSKQSAWKVIETDLSFDEGFKAIRRGEIFSADKSKALTYSNKTSAQSASNSSCSTPHARTMKMIGDSLKDLLDSIREQRRYYSIAEIESFNKLNGVEKDLKNECVKESCSQELLEKATKLLADARNGTADWLTKLWVQIEDADEKSLSKWDKQLTELFTSRKHSKMSDVWEKEESKRSYLGKMEKTGIWTEISTITSNILGNTNVAVTQKEDLIDRLNNKLKIVTGSC